MYQKTVNEVIELGFAGKSVHATNIRLLVLMKIIAQAEWIIDENVYSDMLQVSGHQNLFKLKEKDPKSLEAIKFAFSLWNRIK